MWRKISTRRGERTLGVMPLYHTMGVRSLLAMSLIGGTFVCLPRFDAARALQLIAGERITNLYLVPTLYHDLVHHPRFAGTDVSSVRKLGFAGAPMTDGAAEEARRGVSPDLFVNHYGRSEIYTFTIEQDAPPSPARPAAPASTSDPRGQARRPSADELAHAGEEGEIIALLAGDESFEGYWRRPDADAKALRDGWYFTGDTGYFDADGDLFVTGRVDDMIITGGENVSPVEIESCLSLHPAVSEVAVVGPAGRALGQGRHAFVKRARGGRGRDSSSSAGHPGWPISSGRAATSSSPRSRNLQSASCCAASSSQANTAGARSSAIGSDQQGTTMSMCTP